MKREKSRVYSFVELAIELLDGWGREYPSKEKAIEKLSHDVNGSGLAALGILKFLEDVRRGLSTDNAGKDGRYKIDEYDFDKAKKFAGAKVGDVLYYCCDLDEGVKQSVVVGVKGEYVLVVDETVITRGGMYIDARWADKFYHLTIAEALRRVANSDLDYHNKNLENANCVLKKLESGSDLSEFVRPPYEPIDDDDSDEE